MTEKEFRALLAIEGKKLTLESVKDDWGIRRWRAYIQENDWVIQYFTGNCYYSTKSNAVRATITAYFRHANNR